MPGIDWENETSDSRGRPLLMAAQAAGLDQLVKGATHTKGNRLDLILTNISDRVHGIQDEGRLGASDHIMLSIKVETGGIDTRANKRRRNWRKANYTNIRNELRSTDWTYMFENKNVEERWNIFLKKG